MPFVRGNKAKLSLIPPKAVAPTVVPDPDQHPDPEKQSSPDIPDFVPELPPSSPLRFSVAVDPLALKFPVLRTIGEVSETVAPAPAPAQQAKKTRAGTPLARPLAPPPMPLSWQWRCHNCHAVYKLGCTRRCLECSHDFCTGVSSPVAGRRSGRHRRGGPCGSEFDYEAWAAWGSWRREMTGPNNRWRNERFATHRPVTRAAAAALTRWEPVDDETQLARVAARKEKLYMSRAHNCWMHCDYPSECHHVAYAAKTRPSRAAAGGSMPMLHDYLDSDSDTDTDSSDDEYEHHDAAAGAVVVDNTPFVVVSTWPANDEHKDAHLDTDEAAATTEEADDDDDDDDDFDLANFMSDAGSRHAASASQPGGHRRGGSRDKIAQLLGKESMNSLDHVSPSASLSPSPSSPRGQRSLTHQTTPSLARLQTATTPTSPSRAPARTSGEWDDWWSTSSDGAHSPALSSPSPASPDMTEGDVTPYYAPPQVSVFEDDDDDDSPVKAKDDMAVLRRLRSAFMKGHV